jgi:hypothetical protein
LPPLNLWEQFKHAAAHGDSPNSSEPKQHDAMESFGRVSPDVTEALIQREQASPSTAGGVGDERIWLPLQSLVRNGVHEVPETAEIVSQFGGQVLVELYAHPPIKG